MTKRREIKFRACGPRRILNKAIIWLFEKYAYDYWVDKSMAESDREEMKKHGVDTIEELRQIQVELSQQPFKEAYDAGRADGYNECLEEAK